MRDFENSEELENGFFSVFYALFCAVLVPSSLSFGDFALGEPTSRVLPTVESPLEPVRSDASSSDGNNGNNANSKSTGGAGHLPQKLTESQGKQDEQSALPGQGAPKYWDALTNWSNPQILEWSLGLHIGEPTGISGRMFLSHSKAISLQSGWSFAGLSAFHLSTDLLLYLFNPLKISRFEVDSYMGPGIGLKFWQVEEAQLEADGSLVRSRENQMALGLRVPFGLSMYFLRPALEFYCEIAPGMGLFPETELTFDFGGGLLFRFAK